jgi:hypothetical protein
LPTGDVRGLTFRLRQGHNIVLENRQGNEVPGNDLVTRFLRAFWCAALLPGTGFGASCRGEAEKRAFDWRHGVVLIGLEGLAENGVGRGQVAGWLGGARRTLCAFLEVAQDGARRGQGRGWLGGVRRTLWAFLELAQNGARRGQVRGRFGGARRTLCAFLELAQNGARRGQVRGRFGGARRTLCAFLEVAQNGVRCTLCAFGYKSTVPSKGHSVVAEDTNWLMRDWMVPGDKSVVVIDGDRVYFGKIRSVVLT